mmetsp:Transcript_12421/g.36600  ORF Transcript_12421/g.36600 Transcript_12421/m.36600 type:complete len:346 (-) Transcript_12421:559-1596(-)
MDVFSGGRIGVHILLLQYPVLRPTLGQILDRIPLHGRSHLIGGVPQSAADATGIGMTGGYGTARRGGGEGDVLLGLDADDGGRRRRRLVVLVLGGRQRGRSGGGAAEEDGRTRDGREGTRGGRVVVGRVAEAAPQLAGWHRRWHRGGAFVPLGRLGLHAVPQRDRTGADARRLGGLSSSSSLSLNSSRSRSRSRSRRGDAHLAQKARSYPRGARQRRHRRGDILRVIGAAVVVAVAVAVAGGGVVLPLRARRHQRLLAEHDAAVRRAAVGLLRNARPFLLGILLLLQFVLNVLNVFWRDVSCLAKLRVVVDVGIRICCVCVTPTIVVIVRGDGGGGRIRCRRIRC